MHIYLLICLMYRDNSKHKSLTYALNSYHCQALLVERNTMVTRITDLANVAADKFDQQTAAATSLAASMQDTIIALRESSALTATLLDKYVAQNAYLDAATGSVVPNLNCSRASVWETSFSISR